MVICLYLTNDFLPCIQASQHGNADATERINALSQPAPAALSRQEHDNLTETTLVRKRTQAKQRSDARGPIAGPRQGGRQNGQQLVANIRKNSLAQRLGSNHRFPSSPGPVTARYDGDAPEGYPAQRPPQVPLSSSPGSGFRPPIQSGPVPDPGGYFAPPRQQPFSTPQPQSAPPPQGSNNPGPGGYPSPRIPVQRPPSQPQLGGPGQQGRRVVRGGSGSGNPSFSPGPSSSQPARARTPSPPVQSEPPAARPPPAKGPATFQEMGFQSQKLEDKDCVIM